MHHVVKIVMGFPSITKDDIRRSNVAVFSVMITLLPAVTDDGDVFFFTTTSAAVRHRSSQSCVAALRGLPNV